MMMDYQQKRGVKEGVLLMIMNLHCMCQARQMMLFRRILSFQRSFKPLNRFHFGDVSFWLQRERERLDEKRQAAISDSSIASMWWEKKRPVINEEKPTTGLPLPRLASTMIKRARCT